MQFNLIEFIFVFLFRFRIYVVCSIAMQKWRGLRIKTEGGIILQVSNELPSFFSLRQRHNSIKIKERMKHSQYWAGWHDSVLRVRCAVCSITQSKSWASMEMEKTPFKNMDFRVLFVVNVVTWSSSMLAHNKREPNQTNQIHTHVYAVNCGKWSWQSNSGCTAAAAAATT